MEEGSEDHIDPLEGLEERLISHNNAFESLLALTPAREYYGSHFVDGQDPSEQWNRKKQTKEEKRAAKKAKLDPANQKSALDVMKEREAEVLKRKREDEAGDEDGRIAAVGGKKSKSGKLRKVDEDADAAEARRREKAERRKEKRERKREKQVKKQAKVEAKKARKQDQDLVEAQPEQQRNDQMEDDTNDDKLDFSGLADEEEAMEIDDKAVQDAASQASSAPTTPLIDSPAFDLATNHSAASSSSSIVPPSATHHPAEREELSPKTTLPAIDTATPSAETVVQPSGIQSPKRHIPNISKAEAQERIQRRIVELRAQRKADGPDGNPAKSRQELVEQRRQRDEQRNAAKKAQRQKEKEDERRRREEQLRGSGSPLSASIFSPRSPQPRESNYSFSKLAFEDGTSADASLTHLQDARKKKGPQDPKTALQAAQSKDARIAGYDSTKRADIAEKDLWLNASKRAHGERVRDDTSLLKKALKRKEKQKGKSELQWQEREEAVVKGREMKQKKRDANLAKRREEKGGKGKKKVKGGGGKKKKGGRPGFEGRFKA